MPDDPPTARILRDKAAKCRRLADAVWDTEVEQRLRELATELDEQAAAEEARLAPPLTKR